MKYDINLDYVSHSLNNKILEELSLAFKRSLTEESESTLNESWIAHENRLMSYVEQGDMDGVFSYLRGSRVTPRVGYDVHDGLLQARYVLVSTITLLARAAIKGGLNENESFMLGDTYIQMSADLNDRNDVLGLAMAAISEYTRRVSETKAAPKRSPTVAFCCSYITEHIHDNISLEKLAELCGISKEHLSRCFKKETGYTVKKYCLAKKLELAVYLLAHSEKSIQDIALFLGFSSHARFSEYFKQRFGNTPKEYRRELR